jgi:TonB family protein
MMLLADLTLRTSVPLAAALLVCLGLRRGSAALRHRVLSIGLLLALLVSPLTALAPSWNVPLLDAPTRSTAVRDTAVVVTSAAAADGPVSTPVDSPRPFTPGQALLIVWFTGMAVGAARMIVGLARLRRTTAAARHLDDGRWSAVARTLSTRFGIARPIDILVTDRRDVLATWGVVRPRVLLPADAPDWPVERVRVVLAHELAHIRRADWLVQILADAFRTLFWFNPAAWLVAHRLRRESEHACDDQVLATGVEPDTYAFHLLDLARETRAAAFVRAAALSMARPSTLEGRIAAMLNRRLDRTVPSRWQIAAVVAALALVAVPASLVRVSAQAGSTLLTGAVYDPSGAVLPNVEVTLENEQKTTATTRSNSSGRFEFTSIAAGRYTLKAGAPGFRPLTTTFELKEPADWERAVTLQVGELQETVKVSGRRTASARPAASPAEPVRIGGNIKAPKKLRHVSPVYPPAMLEAGLEGVVPLEVLIAPDGSVSSVRILSAQVHPELASAAADAVRQWSFSPTLLNGAAVEVRMAVSVEFSLEEKSEK